MAKRKTAKRRAAPKRRRNSAVRIPADFGADLDLDLEQNPSGPWHLREAESWKAGLATADGPGTIWGAGNLYAHGQSAQESKRLAAKKRERARVLTGYAWNMANKQADMYRRRGNPDLAWHRERAKEARSASLQRLGSNWEAFDLGQMQAHAVSALAELGPMPGAKGEEFHKILTEAYSRARKLKGKVGNPRQHVPKLKGRGRPEKVRTFKVKLYDAKGTHLATKAGRMKHSEALAEAKRSARGKVKGRSVAKAVLEW